MNKDRKDAMSVKKELMKIIKADIDQLPDLTRKVFSQIYFKKKDNSQVAEELGITIDSVRVHRAKARRLLKTEILKQYL